MEDIKFIDALPGHSAKPKGEYRVALEANPGKWAEYAGRPESVYNLARQMSTHGAQFEGAVRGGVGYLRCVKRA